MKMTETDAKFRDATVKKHYERLAEQYDDFLYYSPDFVRTLTSKMVQELDLQKGDLLVDLGCGTGMYSIDILKQVPLTQPVIGVDPFTEMLEGIPSDAPMKKIDMDALTFSEQQGNYDKILIKEAVHHVEDRPRLFANLYQRLNAGGRVLLVHVPPKLDYPLFEKALRRAENWHADPDELVALLKEAGFEVRRDAIDFPQRIPKEKYFQMVASCYMSVLSSFTDEEIGEGLKEMEEKYADRDVLEYTDHFDYITGIKG